MRMYRYPAVSTAYIMLQLLNADGWFVKESFLELRINNPPRERSLFCAIGGEPQKILAGLPRLAGGWFNYFTKGEREHSCEEERGGCFEYQLMMILALNSLFITLK